jgi:hypothetical protein
MQHERNMMADEMLDRTGPQQFQNVGETDFSLDVESTHGQGSLLIRL